MSALITLVAWFGFAFLVLGGLVLDFLYERHQRTYTVSPVVAELRQDLEDWELEEPEWVR